MFYHGMLSVNGFSGINNYYKTANTKTISFTSLPDTFEPSVVNSFSEVMKNKFSERDLVRLSKKTPEVQADAEILAKTKLASSDILDNLFYNSTAKVDAKKIAAKVNELEELSGENLSEIKLNVNNYDNSVFDITAIDKNRNKKTVTLDENFKTGAVQDVIVQNENGKIYEIKSSKDFKTGITSKVKSEIINDKKIPVSEIIVAKDFKEYSEPSDVKGIFNIKRIYNDGRVQQLSSGNFDKNTGILTVKKDFESLDGTKTYYELKEDKLGNRNSEYKVIDKNGNILLNESKTFKVIDKNTFVSTKNGVDYEIKYSDDNRNLSLKNKQTNETKDINLYSYVLGNSDKLIPVLKKLSGDELMKMGDNVTRLFQTDVDDDSRYFYHPGRKDVTTYANEYIMLHELGHSKDMKNYDITTFKTKDATENTLISANEDVLKTYQAEKKLFNKNFSNTQREHIDYFLNSLAHSSGKNGAVKESLAEINALLNTYNSVEKYSLRSEYLQRYFPKTIAKIAQFL